MGCAELLSLEVPCDSNAPRVVRNALAKFDSLGWVLGDITLVASELVTNAVLHSGCAREDVLRVEVRVRRGGVEISVQDPGLSDQIAQPRPQEELEGGWGLRVVEQLTTRWGSERGSGYRVWAEVALPSVSTRGSPAFRSG
jgi:anti-sigma regulatory factor (Ser/Thr protein kinase)